MKIITFSLNYPKYQFWANNTYKVTFKFSLKKQSYKTSLINYSLYISMPRNLIIILILVFFIFCIEIFIFKNLKTLFEHIFLFFSSCSFFLRSLCFPLEAYLSLLVYISKWNSFIKYYFVTLKELRKIYLIIQLYKYWPETQILSYAKNATCAA